jgi:hypothetical protein
MAASDFEGAETREVIPPEVLHLRDLILAEVQRRDVHLEERFLRLERGRPVLHLRLGERALRGCHVELPGDPAVAAHGYAPDVITVHGSGDRSSRTWPRKLDGSFDIEAVTGHILHLVEVELNRPRPELHVPAGVPARSSGLHVVHLAGVRLGVIPTGAKAEDLLEQVKDEKIRARIDAHLGKDGLTEGDVRALVDTVPMNLWRPNVSAFEPFEPFEPLDDRTLTVLVIGETKAAEVERRYVLILDHHGDQLVVADPAGPGLTTVARTEFNEAWKVGAVRGRPWVALVGAR